MSDWYSLIQNFAAQRIDQIEQHMNSNPEAFPVFTNAARALNAKLDELEAAHNEVFAAHDELWMTYSAALAFEMYLAGARDGGRIYHAFITGELPRFRNRRMQTNIHIPDPEILKAMREQFPKGCRVRLNSMNDFYRPDLKAGSLGTVMHVDDIGTIHVAWDCGSSLGVVFGVDSCSPIDAEEDEHD